MQCKWNAWLQVPHAARGKSTTRVCGATRARVRQRSDRQTCKTDNNKHEEGEEWQRQLAAQGMAHTIKKQKNS